jgi:hypothetical protein
VVYFSGRTFHGLRSSDLYLLPLKEVRQHSETPDTTQQENGCDFVSFSFERLGKAPRSEGESLDYKLEAIDSRNRKG